MSRTIARRAFAASISKSMCSSVASALPFVSSAPTYLRAWSAYGKLAYGTIFVNTLFRVIFSTFFAFAYGYVFSWPLPFYPPFLLPLLLSFFDSSVTSATGSATAGSMNCLI